MIVCVGLIFCIISYKHSPSTLLATVLHGSIIFTKTDVGNVQYEYWQSVINIVSNAKDMTSKLYYNP